MDNKTLLKNLLEGPYSHFQNVGTDDFRDPSEKNPALSLSSKGYKNHRTGESGGLQELVKKHGNEPDNPQIPGKHPNTKQNVWDTSTVAKPGTRAHERSSDYLSCQRRIPKESYEDLLDLGLLRWNEYKGEGMLVYTALDWDGLKVSREGGVASVKRLQRIILNQDNSKNRKLHLGSAKPPYAFIINPLSENLKSKEGIVLEGLEDGLSLRQEFSDAWLFVASDKGSLKHCGQLLQGSRK